MINLATFNIFWYPGHAKAQNQRDQSDDMRIAQVLASLSAHALVFQEILDLKRLESLLQGVIGHDYRLRRKPGGAWLTSGNSQSTSSQKIVCAYYAFDRDPALDEVPAAEEHWLRRTTNYRLVPYQFALLQVAPNLYRISDHRPVCIRVHDA